MKLRSQMRVILPYLGILAVYALLMAVGVPWLVRRGQLAAAETGAGFNPTSLVIYVVVISVVGLFAGLYVNLRADARQRHALNQLTQATRDLGEGWFKELEIPEDVGPLPETQALKGALESTAREIQYRMEAILKEQSMLSAVLSQMTDGLLIADDNGRVLLLNKMAEKLFMISQEKALGRSVVEVMRHHALVELWEKFRGGESKSITLEMGVNRNFLQVVGIRLDDEIPGRSMLLFQDLTQTHRLEIVRRDFISNISHELRTPMASLKALSETLLDGALEDPPAARRFVVRMDTEVDNLSQLVNELLELSRIESGRTNFDFQRVFPCGLMAKACERMTLQAERMGLSVGQECPDNLPQIFADPARISQVFINLIHNAIKFTPAGGKIQLSAWQDGGFVVFRVADTGVGIAQKDVSRIFERFYKADRARAGGGTGLGLSICKHMVEAHGGKIWAESEEGNGANFFFTIPVAST